MQSLSIKKQNNISTVAVVIITMVFIGVLSAFFIAHEAGHKCHCEDCPICSFVHHCDNAIRELGNGIALSVIFVIPVLFIGASVFPDSFDIIRETPITKKIRLND